MTTQYNLLREQAVACLRRYSLAGMVEDMSIDTIHTMMRKHAATLKECDSFAKGKIIANEALSKAMGIPIQVDEFIKDEKDQRALYSVFVQWRDSLV